MKSFLLKFGRFLALALLGVTGARGDVATSDPSFELSSAIPFPAKVEIKQNSGRDPYMLLPNGGIINPGERWRLSLTPTGSVKGVRNLKTRTYYEMFGIKVSMTLPPQYGAKTYYGERQRNFNEVKERENGMSWSGSNKFYIVAGADGTSLRIVKLIQ